MRGTRQPANKHLEFSQLTSTNDHFLFICVFTVVVFVVAVVVITTIVIDSNGILVHI